MTDAVCDTPSFVNGSWAVLATVHARTTCRDMYLLPLRNEQHMVCCMQHLMPGTMYTLLMWSLLAYAFVTITCGNRHADGHEATLGEMAEVVGTPIWGPAYHA